MRVLNKFTQPYKKGPINIQIKSRNLALVLMVVAAVSLIMGAVHVLTGKLSNLPVPVLAVLLSLTGLFFLARSRYKAVSFAYLFALAFLPFSIAITQTSLSYRDLYMYFFFCAPVLILSVIVGYKSLQLWTMAFVQTVMGIAYVIIAVLGREVATLEVLSFGLLFALAFYALICVFLSVSFSVERSIMTTLQRNNYENQQRMKHLNELLKTSQNTLSIGQKLSQVAEISAREVEKIETDSLSARSLLGSLNETVNINVREHQRLDEGPRRRSG